MSVFVCVQSKHRNEATSGKRERRASPVLCCECKTNSFGRVYECVSVHGLLTAFDVLVLLYRTDSGSSCAASVRVPVRACLSVCACACMSE